jgi:hypothetical protein
MRAPNGVNGNGQHRQRVADELRQLKQMSKGLRTQALRAVMDRAASQRAAAKPTATLPKAAPKASPIAA